MALNDPCSGRIKRSKEAIMLSDVTGVRYARDNKVLITRARCFFLATAIGRVEMSINSKHGTKPFGPHGVPVWAYRQYWAFLGCSQVKNAQTRRFVAQRLVKLSRVWFTTGPYPILQDVASRVARLRRRIFFTRSSLR